MSNPRDDRFSELWAATPESAFEKLGVSLDDGTTGFDLRSFPASTWLIHAMFETEMESPSSHDARQKQLIADGIVEPLIINGVNVFADTTDTGISLGWATAPGGSYRRVRWRDYASRNRLPLLAEGQWPSYRGFRATTSNDGSWPENVRPPAEGSIDKESWLALLDVLIAHSIEGGDTQCTAFYTPWTLKPADSHFLLGGRLRDAYALSENPASIGSPQNFWPDGLEWFVYTDYDLQASRISGSPELIGALLASSELDCENLGGVAA